MNLSSYNESKSPISNLSFSQSSLKNSSGSFSVDDFLSQKYFLQFHLHGEVKGFFLIALSSLTHEPRKEFKRLILEEFLYTSEAYLSRLLLNLEKEKDLFSQIRSVNKISQNQAIELTQNNIKVSFAQKMNFSSYQNKLSFFVLGYIND